MADLGRLGRLRESESPAQGSVEGHRQRRRAGSRRRRSLRDDLDFGAVNPPWLEIDLGEPATLAGLEVYWGKHAPGAYAFKSSLDDKSWSHLCRTHHGEGGQDVFAFPPVAARFVRWTCDDPQPERGPEIVEFNLYGPTDAASVLEPGRVAALGHAPVRLPLGESITVDFGWVRSPLGAFIEWGQDYGTVFSVHLSDDGESFREVGRIETGDGGSDSFWWRSTTARYFRLTVHEASAPEGAVVNELKLRVLNKDRMPIGQLERAALAGRGDLYPQSLLGRQVYWTVLGDFDQEEEALFDEYGNLEPQRGAGQTMPFLRLNGVLHGARRQPGAQPIPCRRIAAGSKRRLVRGGHRTSHHRARSRGPGDGGISRREPERGRRRRARLFWRPVLFRSIRTGSTAATPPSTRSPPTARCSRSTTSPMPRSRPNPGLSRSPTSTAAT